MAQSFNPHGAGALVPAVPLISYQSKIETRLLAAATAMARATDDRPLAHVLMDQLGVAVTLPKRMRFEPREKLPPLAAPAGSYRSDVQDPSYAQTSLYRPGGPRREIALNTVPTFPNQ